MLLMHLQGKLYSKPDCAMFVDLGWESESTYTNLHRLQAICKEHCFPFYWIRRRNIRDDILAATRNSHLGVKTPPLFLRSDNGKVGMLTRQCTGSYKKEAMRSAIRELLSVPPHSWMRNRVEIWLGITTDESHRLNNSSGVLWQVNRFPLVEQNLSRQDCIDWLRDHGHPIPPKSACLGCPYRSDADLKDMKTNRPEEWKSVVEVDRAIRSGINCIKKPLFIHRSLQPIENIEFDNEHNDLDGV
jgi:hypothetical protein